jgi:hypothetical protein
MKKVINHLTWGVPIPSAMWHRMTTMRDHAEVGPPSRPACRTPLGRNEADAAWGTHRFISGVRRFSGARRTPDPSPGWQEFATTHVTLHDAKPNIIVSE